MSIFLLLLLLLLSRSISLTYSLNDEGLALLSFKSATTADPRRSLADWNSSDPTPCSWSGVTCDRSLKVVAFSLPRASLSANLPPTLLTFLPNLRHLNLRSNRLHGPLPSLPFPPSLQSLLLSSNSLSGPIPKSLSNLSSLQVLDLSQNTLSGPIPQTLTQCRRLKTLDLSRNSLSGPLPAEFGARLAQLERLDLSYNKLTGPIPEDVGKLSNLEGTADFSHNLFSGSIPSSLGQLPEKVYIDLSYNNLSGPIPQTGALENRGPTAFIGNPGLCGPPLKTPCPFSPPNSPPSGSHASESPSDGGGLGRGALVGIIVSDVIGIALIALLFFYCYQKAITSRDKSLKETKGTKECLCFTKEESQTFSENVEHVELVTLDKGVSFDLDELLKASAFVLGKSGIGIVYKVVLDDGLTLAVRRLGEGGSQRFKEFKMEVEAIGRVRHPNIVSLRAYYWSVEEKLLIYDYIPNGNLSVALHGRSGALPFQPLSWDLRQKIMKGIARGLTHLHEFSPKKYVHGDIKPNNVLLGLKMEPYISDFGLGRLANIAAGPSLPQSNRIGTENSHLERTSSPAVNFKLCYQAPEALKALKPSQKWDVYSYGVILLELISGRSPAVLMETSKMDLVRWIQLCIEDKKPLLDVLDPFLSNELDVREDDIIAVLKIALACVQANPERRPSMRSVVETLERLSVS